MTPTTDESRALLFHRSLVFVACFLPLLAVLPCVNAQQTDEAEATRSSAAGDEKTAVVPGGPVDPFPQALEVPPGILDGGTEWLNTSGPIDLKQLRGKVVLLDFWTYCCINCIHVLPDLKFLEEKYPNELVVIGVHSAKFDNEKLSDNIRDAILRYEIRHPVVNDSEMLIWRKFGTRAWPTLALIDPQGRFIGRQGGEGNRELFDGVIAKLIDYHRAKGTLDETPIVFDLEENRATKTALRFPGKVLADAASNRLFISDSNHNRIIITDPDGQFVDAIGNGQIGRTNGSFQEATFDHPQGMVLVDDVLYIADTENHMIRAADLNAKTVTTLSGTGEQGTPRIVDGRLKETRLNSPWDLCCVKDKLFIAMAGPHQIWSHRLGTGQIGVHAGNAREDVINGELDSSSFAQPSGLALDDTGEFFFVADSEGSSIRKVPVATGGEVTTIAGTSEIPQGQSLFAFGDVDGVGDDARFQHPLGVAWHDGMIYVADSYNHKIRKVDPSTQAVTTWLGTGSAGNGTDPVQLSEPAGLSVAGDQLFIADTNNHRICRVNLKTKEFAVVELKGVEPPAQPRSRRIPDPASAIELNQQTVAASESVTVHVDLNVPDGFKLNTLAPAVYSVYQRDGDQILDPAILDGRKELTPVGDDAEFRIRLSGLAGKADIVVELSYGYCDKNDGLCRLASGLWKFTLETAEDSENATIALQFRSAAPKPVPEKPSGP